MALHLNGSALLVHPAAVVATYPFSMMIWVSKDNIAAMDILAQGQSNADRYTLFTTGNDGSLKSLVTRNPGVPVSATKTDTPNFSTTMQLAILVLTSASSRTLYFGSNTGVTNSSAATDDLASYDRTVIGGFYFNSVTGPSLAGNVAEAHFFNVALDSTQRAALFADTVKPEATTGYVDGWKFDAYSSGGTYTSIGGSRTMSVVGGVVTDAGTHPISRTTPVPVSFSGPVPTRNGVLGTATTFANAGFFAGNLTPFAYSSVGTALPAGVTLNTSTGVLSLAASGATAGTTSGIIIRATDTGSNVANTNAYSIVIAASNAAPTFPGNISNISGTAGSAITPVNVSGQFSDTDALTYSASPAGTAWPSGLVVNSSTGIISGTVAGAGTTSGLKVRATDTASQTVDSNAFNAVIAASSTTRTWTPTIKLEALADETPFASHAIHAIINDMAGNLIDTKTGLTTNSVGLPPPFTTSTGALTTDYRVSYVDDVDLTIFAVENLRCV